MRITTWNFNYGKSKQYNIQFRFLRICVIKAVNGDNTFPPTNSLETNVGDMIIGTNDFTIETYIKFDDVNQDHRIIRHNETSRNRSSWLLYHRGDQKENNGEEGRIGFNG